MTVNIIAQQIAQSSIRDVTIIEKINRKVYWAFLALRRFGIDFGYYIFDSLILNILRPLKELNVEKKTVLFVRLDAIGDFILWTATLRSYEKKYPKKTWRWILIGNEDWIDLAKELSLFDKVICLNRSNFSKKPFERYKKIKELLGLRVDELIHPTHSRTFVFSETVVRVIKAKKKLGPVGDFSNIQPLQAYLARRWYSNLFYCGSLNKMELDRHLEFLNSIGIHEINLSKPKISISDEYSRQVLNDFKLESNMPYFIIFPGASWAGKRWPLDRFISVASKVIEKTGWKAIVLGGGYEQHLINSMKEYENEKLKSIICKTNIMHFAAIVRNAKFVISNDTAAVHMATALNVPSVAIAGGGHFGRFLPYKINNNYVESAPSVIHAMRPCFNCNWECIYKNGKNEPTPCLSDIQVESVMTIVDKILRLL